MSGEFLKYKGLGEMEVTFVITNQGFQRACVERAAEPLHFFISLFLFAIKTRIEFNQRGDTEIDCWGVLSDLNGPAVVQHGLRPVSFGPTITS